MYLPYLPYAILVYSTRYNILLPSYFYATGPESRNLSFIVTNQPGRPSRIKQKITIRQPIKSTPAFPKQTHLFTNQVAQQADVERPNHRGITLRDCEDYDEIRSISFGDWTLQVKCHTLGFFDVAINQPGTRSGIKAIVMKLNLLDFVSVSSSSCMLDS